jgi:signal transduction histidine kinase
VTTVTVHVWSSADSFGVQIEDHGVGFDPQVVPTSSNGLVGMRGRALALGGFFSIASTPGSGTRVMAEWPLTSVAAASPGA